LATTTSKGLKTGTSLDQTISPKGIKITDQEMDELSIERADFHGEADAHRGASGLMDYSSSVNKASVGSI